MASIRALLPAALLALFALLCGTFPGAAAWPAGPAGQALLLVAAVGGIGAAGDPLRLGRAGRWLALALLVAVAGSVAASPVARAGRTALALLPAFLLLPAAAAAAFGGERSRRWALAGWSAAVVAVAVAGLADAAAHPGTRVDLPLGHHNFMGAFLVTTLPVALLPLRSPGPGRWLAAAAGLAGGAALAGTRSLSAVLAAGVVALVAARGLGRFRHLIAGLALLALGLAVPRVAAVVAGADPSFAARHGYYAAALDGIAARAWGGWGPGSTPWRLAAFLHPVPGVHPPGELVGEAHSLPLGLAFELGVPGLLLGAAVVGLFAARRWRARDAASDRGLVAAGLLGLLGAAVAGLGDAWLAVPALPVAIALSAGAALAGAGQPAPTRPALRVAALLVLAVGAAALVGPARAWRSWSAAAAAADRAGSARALAEAARLDPDFPLYAARWAWLAPAPAPIRARVALEAARAAGAVAPLWLRAGGLGWEAGEASVARGAILRAMALDPLSGSAPFLLFVASSGTRVDCAARALLAEPRLAAATAWRRHPAARDAALAAVLAWPGIDEGWREELVRRARAAPPAAAGAEEVDLAVEIDRTPELSGSLHLFRRSPLADDVARIRLDAAAARAMKMPAAAQLASSSPSAFPADRCAPAELAVPPADAAAPLFRDGFETGDAERWRREGEPSD